MNDFPFDHDSGRAMNRHRSDAKAEAGLEHRKLREEIERLRGREKALMKALSEIEVFGNGLGRANGRMCASMAATARDLNGAKCDD